jgi:hypothetical protein
MLLGTMVVSRRAEAGICRRCGQNHHQNCCHGNGYCSGPGDIIDLDSGGTWYWMRSPEQERRVVMTLFNRYCIRCHGVDGRGVWDIPDVPDFTDPRWQASRPEGYRARIILEGRGAVMPPFRGTLTLEEACAMARYLYTFVPGTEVSRPDLFSTPPPAANAPAPAPAGAATPAPAGAPTVAPAPAGAPAVAPAPAAAPPSTPPRAGAPGPFGR